MNSAPAWRAGPGLALGLAVLLLGLATPPRSAAQGFLDQLICEMDPLYDYCLGKRMVREAAEMKPGPERDLAYVSAFAAFHFAQRSEEEKRLRPPRRSFFQKQIERESADLIVAAIDSILRAGEIEAGLQRFARITAEVPRARGYPLLIRALWEAGARDRAKAALADFAALATGIDGPGRRISALTDLADAAIRLGDRALVEQARAGFLETLKGHPNPAFRKAMGVDIAPAAAFLSDREGAERLIAEAESLLEADARMPPRIRADLLARITRARGRMGAAAAGEAAGMQALALLEELPPRDRVRVLLLLFQAGFDY